MHATMIRTSLVSCLLLAPALRAQSDRVLPAGDYSRVWAGNNGTGTGYATQNGISQNLYIAPFAATSLVSAVGFRRTATTTNFASVSIDFEMSLSSTTATLATLSATFANNRGTDFTVVVPRAVISIPARPANSSPSDFVALPIATPWLFNGPNLLIECKSYGTGSVNVWRMDRCFERTTAGEAINWGTACSTATVGGTSPAPSYMPGSSFTLTLASNAASQPALALMGFDLTNFLGLPLPFDLTVAGMTSCTLLVPPSIVFGTVTDAGGAASLSIPIPNDNTLSGAGLGMQWLYFDPNAGNPLGAVTTVGRLVHIGPLICPNRYVWDLANVNATSGSLQAGGPIARVTTIP